MCYFLSFLIALNESHEVYCTVVELEQRSDWSSLNEPPYLFRYATGKAGNLVQEVWGSKTTQQGQMVDYFQFAIAAFRATRVACILCKHITVCVCVCALHDYVHVAVGGRKL